MNGGEKTNLPKRIPNNLSPWAWAALSDLIPKSRKRRKTSNFTGEKPGKHYLGPDTQDDRVMWVVCTPDMLSWKGRFTFVVPSPKPIDSLSLTLKQRLKPEPSCCRPSTGLGPVLKPSRPTGLRLMPGSRRSKERARVCWGSRSPCQELDLPRFQSWLPHITAPWPFCALVSLYLKRKL